MERKWSSMPIRLPVAFDCTRLNYLSEFNLSEFNLSEFFGILVKLDHFCTINLTFYGMFGLHF